MVAGIGDSVTAILLTIVGRWGRIFGLSSTLVILVFEHGVCVMIVVDVVFVVVIFGDILTR